MSTPIPHDSHKPDLTNPSWKELSTFIQAQNQASQALIDRWFTLAIRVLGILVLSISLGLGIFGWRTLADVKATAEQSARAEATTVATTEATKVAERVAKDVSVKAADKAATDAATAQVKSIMQDPQVQKLVRDTAAELFREGVYKEDVEKAVHEQMQAAITEGLVGNYVVSINGSPDQRLGITSKLPR